MAARTEPKLQLLPMWLRGRRRGRYPGDARLDRVAPWLVIGPALHPKQYGRLSALGVTHVVDLRAEGGDDESLLVQAGIEWGWFGVRDRSVPTPGQFRALLDWLDAQGERAVVYLHCQGGLGRTPTVAAALLVARGFSPSEALHLVRAARPEISPTEAQRRWLEGLREAPRLS